MSPRAPESTRPLWAARSDAPAPRPLDADTEADVCVIGAGIAGLSVAYEAALENRSVVVLEADDIASGETGRSTAQLATAIDDRYLEIERVHGVDAVRLAAHSHARAIDRIAEICTAEDIACGFERLDGWLFAGPTSPADLLEREYDAARRAGLVDVELLARGPHPLELGRCLRFPRQAQMDPVAYVRGLARAVERAGGRVFTRSRAQTVEGRGPITVRTAHGPIVTADDVVVATNAPFNDLFALHLKQVAYRSYVVVATVPKRSVPRALFWDTLDPYHYVRIDRADPRHDLLIVGGEDHKTGHESAPGALWERLEAWMREVFPMAGHVVARWSGQVREPSDGIAFIGKNPSDGDHVFVVTGDSGMGITHGAIAGLLVSDLIVGRDNPWGRLYSPARVKGIGQLLRDDVGAILPFADWIKPGGARSESVIACGEGATIREGAGLLAVYRDESGEVFRCSAACPHLGAPVRWNPAEKSWDCPSHGSRFDAHGDLLCGPANVGLTKI